MNKEELIREIKELLGIMPYANDASRFTQLTMKETEQIIDDFSKRIIKQDRDKEEIEWLNSISALGQNLSGDKPIVWNYIEERLKHLQEKK